MNPAENSFPHARILVVDDNAENVQLVARSLGRAGYLDIELITDSAAAMASIQTSQRDIILLDLHMPAPDGYEILGALRTDGALGRSTPVLVFTADVTAEARSRALNAGASEFLTKPGDAQEILHRVKNFLQLRQMHLALECHTLELEIRVRERTRELATARREALEILARASDFRDDETGQHARRVGELSASIAHALGESDDYVEILGLAAPLHDVGKIAVPDSILLKPGKLDSAETQVMRRHTVVPESLFGDIESPLMQMAKEIAINHHERWDGTGYPRGLSAEMIPLAARIVAVADVFDALTHERPYKIAWVHDTALKEIVSLRGQQFDPEVVDAFIALLGIDAMSDAA